MLLNNISYFDSYIKSFSSESADELNKISLNFDLKILDSKHFPTDIKFDYYFHGKDTGIYDLNCRMEVCKTKIFDVIYPKNISLFTIIDNYSSSDDQTFLKRKRSSQRQVGKKRLDNIFKKIKTGFFNTALFNKFNEKLKNIGSLLYLERFPQQLVSITKKERNKKLLNMTLLEIFKEKDLYMEKDLTNYYHNLKVVTSEDVQENAEFMIVLNKKCYKLYEEYINSKEFSDEIDRLKDKNTDDYIQKYINAAKHFIGHLSRK